MTAEFAGQVALVTGGARGQGRAIALELARRGAAVAICDLDGRTVEGIDYPLGSSSDLMSTRDELAVIGSAFAMACDVTDEQQVKSLVDATTTELGNIDILVNNAGVVAAGGTPAHLLSSPDWAVTIGVNLTGVWQTSRAVIPSMIEQEYGRIINIASVMGLLGSPRGAHYSASKHGVVGLTRSLSTELAAHGVTANAVCPGVVETPMIETALSRQSEASLVSRQSIKKLIAPEDVAYAVGFLASPRSRYITGIALPVDAGWTAH